MSRGCGVPLPSGVTKGAITNGMLLKVDDPFNPHGKRRYSLYVPRSYEAGSAMPLVLDFHGFYDTAASEAKEDGVSLAAEREGFIIAYPNGLADNPSDPGDWWNQWNGGGTNGTAGKYGKQTCTESHSKYPCYKSCGLAGMCDASLRHRVDCGCSGCADDTGFIAALLRKLKDNLCLDESRIHGTGMSNGAIFLYSLATSDVVGPQLASIVPVEGSFVLGFLDAPKVPMPIIDIHGTKDDCVPANVSNSWGPYKRKGCPQHMVGKEGCVVGDDGWFYHPQAEILAKWSSANLCSSNATSIPIATPHDGHTDWSCKLPFGNQCGAEIRVCTHSLGHTWPFNEGIHRVRTKEFGEMLWSFMKDKQRKTLSASTLVV